MKDEAEVEILALDEQIQHSRPRTRPAAPSGMAAQLESGQSLPASALSPDPHQGIEPDERPDGIENG